MRDQHPLIPSNGRFTAKSGPSAGERSSRWLEANSQMIEAPGTALHYFALRADISVGEYLLIGIGEAVARLPLPHHRAYGSVHGGSIGYASTRQSVKEGRAI